MKLPGGFWKGFGPGLLWAAAAIGVSHLVQSTRAGALAGFGLVGVVLLALILKYPFFEYGPRYAAATGNSLVEGYRRIGMWALWLFFILMIVSSVIVQAAIVLFTAFLFTYVTGTNLPLPMAGAIVIGVCFLILRLGRFRLLDLVIKVVLVALAVSTLWAAAVSVPIADFSTVAIWPPVGDLVPFAFLLALAGWMPSALDIAVWNSLWTLAKDTSEGGRASVDTARLDFNIGYVGTGILAFAFVLLGATVMFNSGQEFSEQGTAFSVQLVELYSVTVGEWLRPVVLVAVFATMFSTSLTVVDGYPRALDRCVQNIVSRADPQPNAPLTPVYWMAMAVLAVTTLLIMWRFLGSLTDMVDFATIFTFITAPILGWFNLKAVTSPDVPVQHRPGPLLRGLSYLGLLLLGGTGVVFLVTVLG